MVAFLFAEGPPFLPESFDGILLDAPCSGMGQRPNMAYSLSLKEVTSYQPLQRKLFRVVCINDKSRKHPLYFKPPNFIPLPPYFSRSSGKRT